MSAAARAALAVADCPVARAVDVVGDQWSLLIIRDVFDGLRRFGELQRSVGASRNILTERLRRLVSCGVLETRPASDGTSYREYALTEKGLDLFEVVVALRQWGEGHLFADGEQHSRLVGVEDDRPVGRLEVRDASGARVTHRDAYVQKVAREG